MTITLNGKEYPKYWISRRFNFLGQIDTLRLNYAKRGRIYATYVGFQIFNSNILLNNRTAMTIEYLEEFFTPLKITQ